jgi:hypothetical protein
MIALEVQYRGTTYHSETPIVHAVETGELLKYRGTYYPVRRAFICTNAQLDQRLVYRGLAY